MARNIGAPARNEGAPLHCRAASLAQQRETSLNALVTEALARYLEGEEGR